MDKDTAKALLAQHAPELTLAPETIAVRLPDGRTSFVAVPDLAADMPKAQPAEIAVAEEAALVSVLTGLKSEAQALTVELAKPVLEAGKT